jgi:electron transfer flavoprotein alpha subunit
MESILLLAHTESDGALARPALEALSAALAIAEALPGASLGAGLCGAEVQPAADQIVASGISRIVGVAGSNFGAPRYSTDASAFEAICRETGATIVVAAHTSRASRALPGVAGRLKGRADTHVTHVGVSEGRVCVARWYYRQRMEGVLEREHRPWFILIEPGSFEPWAGGKGVATVERVHVAWPEIRTTVMGTHAPAAHQQTIRPDADLLFVAGAGWTKKQADGNTHAEEAEQCIREFLSLSQASLGGSKSLVDLSCEGHTVLPLMTHLNQVGQTGSTPRHPKGLSTCCHGEEPHVVGWRFITERRAVNMDPKCGWARGKADVLYVADAFEVMAKVNALLAEKSSAGK